MRHFKINHVASIKSLAFWVQIPNPTVTNGLDQVDVSSVLIYMSKHKQIEFNNFDCDSRTK